MTSTVEDTIPPNDNISDEKKEAKSLFDGVSDDPPITKESHPLFFDASKNPGTYHYVPKKGVGLHKDGNKFNIFNYDVSFRTRSMDLFGTDIDEATEANNIHALADAIIAAFGDLVLNGNDDMTSYLYLMKKSSAALSPDVKDKLKLNGLKSIDGGVALGLVTELVATSSAESVFKKAVQPRIDSSNLTGIEAMNEVNIQKAYAAITPHVETQAILLSNGINVTEGWGKKLVAQSPSLDKLVSMDFSKFEKIFETDDSDDSTKQGKWSKANDFVRAPTSDHLVAYKMYAGLLGSPQTAPVPSVRKHLLNQGLSPALLEKVDKDYTSLSDIDDKEIYETVSNFMKNTEAQNDEDTDSEDAKSKLKQFLDESLMKARQTSIVDTAEGYVTETGHLVSQGVSPIPSLGNKIRGALRGKASLTGSIGGIGSSVLGKLTGAGAGAGAGAVSGLAAIAGPVGVALALAPLIKSLASATDKDLEKGIAEVTADREKIESEVSDLLASVENLTTEADAKKQKELAEDLLNKVRNPDALTFSKLEGMGLQKQLEALETNFSPTSMASIVPYTSDAELVAGVDGGKALSAMSLFLNPEKFVDVPQRQLLQTPKYVNMMGASTPFQTRSSRSTSEKEMTSFITSSKNSGFTTAGKTSKTMSDSKQGKYVNIGFGGKGKTSSATSWNMEDNESWGNDTEHKDELRRKVTQACVTQFTYMPMKTFRLREGGLVLTQYAYYRLQRITKDEYEDGKKIEDQSLKENMRRKRAHEFLLDFGSHIPFGVQTLGGVHLRTMKITTQSEMNLSQMYSAASSQITESSSKASKKDSSSSVSVGIFGLGGKFAMSNSHSTASASGETKISSQAVGSGQGTTQTTAQFESHVVCFGPNAATPDDLYQQLMSNNATWTVIDRGEPDSYFAIWSLIDYMGQGGMYKEQCRLLKEVWEKHALTNSYGNASEELLMDLMRDYDLKKTMIDFVQALIYCLAPCDSNQFTATLAKEFEDVVTGGVKKMSSKRIISPIDLINEGYNAKFTKKKEANTESDTESETEIVPKFEVVPGNFGYKLAESILTNADGLKWSTNFSYFSDYYKNIILEKGKSGFLVNICRDCYENSDDEPGCFDLVMKLINNGRSNNSDIVKSMMYKDDTRVKFKNDVITGNHCLHYVMKSNNLKLVKTVHQACHAVAEIPNKKVNKIDQDVKIESHETPKDIAQGYDNLKTYKFPLIRIGDSFSMCAIDAEDNAYYKTSLVGSQWNPLGAERFKYISSSKHGASVWAVQTHGEVYYLDRNTNRWRSMNEDEPDVDNIRMRVVEVSGNGRHIWAISVDNKLYYRTNGNWLEKSVKQSESTMMSSISVNEDGTKVVGTDIKNRIWILTDFNTNIWSFDEDLNKENSFWQASISPDGKQISGTTTDFLSYFLTIPGMQLKKQDNNELKLKHVCADNTRALGISADGKHLLMNTGTEPFLNLSQELPSKLPFKHVSLCVSENIDQENFVKYDDAVYLQNFNENNLWLGVQNSYAHLVHTANESVPWVFSKPGMMGEIVKYQDYGHITLGPTPGMSLEGKYLGSYDTGSYVKIEDVSQEKWGIRSTPMLKPTYRDPYKGRKVKYDDIIFITRPKWNKDRHLGRAESGSRVVDVWDAFDLPDTSRCMWIVRKTPGFGDRVPFD